MSDLISRQAAIDATWFEPSYTDPLNVLTEVRDRLKALPSAERKTGRWINAYPDIEPNPMFMYGICSVCGCEQAISNKLNFCPNCGADMRGEQDGH